MLRFTSLISGLLFGMGMVVSGMADTQKVLGFLDVAGAWDPSLAFVMGGALLVFMPFYLLVIKPKQQPLVASEFCVASGNKIDKKLITGASIFGLGWGIAGICPGPVVSSLSGGNSGTWVFFTAMLLGFAVANAYNVRNERSAAAIPVTDQI